MTTMSLELPSRDLEVLQHLESELGAAAAAMPPRALLHEAQLMEQLAGLAAEADSEAEAEAFLGALGSLAASVVPKLARAVPAVVKGVSQFGRQLWRDPGNRTMIRAVPSMLRRSLADLAGQHGAGRPITAPVVTRALARHAAHVLRLPDQRRQVLRDHAALRRRHLALQRARAAQARAAQARRGQAGTPLVPGPRGGAPQARRCPCCGRPY